MNSGDMNLVILAADFKGEICNNKLTINLVFILRLVHSSGYF